MQDIDTGWADELISDGLAIIFAILFSTDPENQGLFFIVYNWIPVLGSNPFSVETWFYICFLGGLMLFMRYYGSGIIMIAINKAMDEF